MLSRSARALRTARQAVSVRSLTSSSPVAVESGPDRANATEISRDRAQKASSRDAGKTREEIAHLGDAPSRTDVNAAQAATDYHTSLVGSTSDEGALMDREEDVMPAGAVSGAPPELMSRRVRIFRPTPTTMQSAKSTSHHWRIDWDILPGSSKYENPLMGWAASADHVQGTHIKFKTKEDAIAYAERQGYPYFVQEPAEPAFKPKSYANNFLYQPGPLRIVRTK